MILMSTDFTKNSQDYSRKWLMTDQHTFDQHLNTYTRLRTWMYSRNNILSLLDESAKFCVVAVVEINLNLWWSIGRWRRVRACRNLEALRTTVVYRWRLPCASHARQEPSHHHRPRHRRFWQIFSTVFLADHWSIICGNLISRQFVVLDLLASYYQNFDRYSIPAKSEANCSSQYI